MEVRRIHLAWVGRGGIVLANYTSMPQAIAGLCPLKVFQLLEHTELEMKVAMSRPLFSFSLLPSETPHLSLTIGTRCVF